MGLKCPKCQHENPVDTLYCGKCGAKFDAETDRTETIKSHRIDKPIAGKYQVLAEQGRGGMGIVYKAKDIKLDRIVALKFLPPGLANDREAKKRFIQEAKAASGLDHANICTIYEIGDTEDGQMFIAMPFYDGESLKEKISQKPLELEEAVSIATQISEGLSRAHKKGIVHRDIKPANIMIAEEGVVKIVDFGIAKLGGEAGLTQTGSTVGTTAYMSPEQTRGEKMDSRSDIWSLGVVLYEMLTGHLPFRGEQMQSMIYSILNTDPEAVTSARQEVPRHLERVIMKALEKDLEKRFQSVDELKRELQISHSAPFPEPKKSIAVLPFVNMSTDPDQEYFSDGLTEEIITDLSHIQDLLVISRSSAMTFKGSKKKITDIAGEVHVRYVLEGSVRKAGNNLRITAQLIDAEKDIHLWAEKYSGTLDDVFEIQEKVSQSIVNALKLKLTAEDTVKIKEHPIVDIRAYEYYFKARQEIYRATAESLRNALQLIENCMKIVGKNELLLASQGYAHWMFYNGGIEPDEKHLKKTERCAEQIFKLNPDSVHGYRLLGLAQAHRGEIKECIQNLYRFIKKEPNDSDSLCWLCLMLSVTGKTEMALSLSKRLIQIDPHSSWNVMFRAVTLYYDRQFFEAANLAKSIYEKNPENPFIHCFYFLYLIAANEFDRAFGLIRESAEDISDDFLIRLPHFLKNAIQNKKVKAFQIANENIKKAARNDLQYSTFLADGFSLLNEKDEAIRWLENAVNRGFIHYRFLNEYDPFLENIRGEEIFKKLMKRVKKEWEHFEVLETKEEEKL